MVIGEAGQGKSALINALIDREVANEGDTFEAGTNSIQEYRLEQNGVQIVIWDTPGFGMESKEEDKKTVELLRSSNCRPIDLALFCFRMDRMRFPTRVHTDTIQKITEVFGKSFWQNCVFVLTFANNIEQLCPKGKELEVFFSERAWVLEEKYREALEKNAGLNKEEVKTVCAVPVGSYRQGMFRENPWALPDREDWFLSFWMECTTHMRNVSAILQVNRERLQLPGEDTSGPPPKLEPCDPYKRNIEASREEILDIDIQMSEDRHIQNLTQEDIKKNVVKSNVPFVQPDSHTMKDGRNRKEEEPEHEQRNLPIKDHEATAGPQEPDSLHTRRDIPLIEILLQQLENHDSGFYEYVKEVAKLRGRNSWGIGHVCGFVEGFVAWLRKRKPNS